jgi:hypothetical protein
MNGMDAAREENELAERERRRELRGEDEDPLWEELDSLSRQLDRLHNRAMRIQARAQREAGNSKA